MINLSPASITTTTAVLNGVSTVSTTDTLLVSYVEIGFASGSVTMVVQQGSMVGSPAVFTPNLPQIRVDVAPDGTFRSSDGKLTGTIPSWPATLAALRTPFDGLLLSNGLASGTAV